MKETKVSVQNTHGERLVGIETLPGNGQGKYPAIILVHGFHVTKEEGGMFDELAGHLASADFFVYRFDFSGCGESDGNYSETSLSKLRDDLKSIVEFVKSQDKVEWVGIHAQSFGTPATVALTPELKALILMGSLSHPKEILSALFDKGYNPHGISERKRSRGRITKVKPQFWKDFENHALLESIQHISCPILFIHGENDTTVPLSEMESYFEAAHEPKEKLILKGADHGLRPKRKEMYQASVDWFTRFI